ncbi:MAG TPA: hypothetical protein VHX20_01815 [Terracidiphilus sp.]|jgi:hypothetical protein|nr:hypothetical protein [Terracidiphilus sp.]
MGVAPENQNYICLSQAEIDAKFVELDMKTHFKNTCNPRSVNITEDKASLPIVAHKRRAAWNFLEFRSKVDDSIRGKSKWRQTVIGEEESRAIWFNGTDGNVYVIDNLDISLLGL